MMCCIASGISGSLRIKDRLSLLARRAGIGLAHLVLLAATCFPAPAQSKENFYWDSVRDISERSAYFPTALSDSDSAYIFFESVDKARQRIAVSWRKKQGNLDWSDTFSLADTFAYSGDDVPDMYSAAVSSSGTIAVSVLDSSGAASIVKVYSSSDGASSFSSFSFPRQQKQITSSRVFASGNGGFILFISLGEGRQSPTESSFSLLFSESADGRNWSSLGVFKPSEMISNAFSPFFTRIGGKDFVFFEGWSGRDSTTSLLYGAFRAAGSAVWSEPFVVTDENSVAGDARSYLDFKNYRPFVLSEGGVTKMVWERTAKTGNTATVMVSPLTDEGRIADRNDVEMLNQFGNGRRPSLFCRNGKFFALWFDDRSGVNAVHLMENLGVEWSEVDSVQRRQSSARSAAFVSAVVLQEKDSLSLVWQQGERGENRIVILSEDYRAAPPSFSARNFTLGKRGNVRNPSVRVVMPDDISGISGFCGIWTRDKDESPALDPLGSQFRAPGDPVITAQVSPGTTEDEILYFKAAVLDRAGNWSPVATYEYYFDQTPPGKVADISFDKDEWGFAATNDVSFSWRSGVDDDDVAGYSWTLTRIAPLDKSLAVSRTKRLGFPPEEGGAVLASLAEENVPNLQKARAPGSKIMSSIASASFRNRDNGVYVFSVRAIDSVGNAGEAESAVLFLNKYKAATQIENVTASADDFGNVSIAIAGEEFSYDGEISEIIITNKNSGERMSFSKEAGDYTVSGAGGGERISGLRIDGMRAGTYSVQIRHSERGLATWKNSLVIRENGTVKYEKQYNFEPVWSLLPGQAEGHGIDTDRLLFWCALSLAVLGILVCARGVLVTARDAVQIRKDVMSVLTGEYMAKEQMEKVRASLRVRFSLRLKFALAITMLLLFIVASVALVIGAQMSRTQERILIEGLKNRVKVVMGNMASGVQTYLDDGRDKLVEIGSVVNQVDNFDEAHYATILSYEIDGKALPDGSRPIDYVWATNDEDIVRKIDSTSFDAGTVRFGSGDKAFAEFCASINEGARKIVDDLSRTTGDKSSLIFRQLNDFSAASYNSYPNMPDDKLDRDTTEYNFYWPVMYQKGSDSETLLQAMILMLVSTDTLVRQVDVSRRIVFSIALVAGATATAFGLLFAFILSSIIVSPIRRIVAHVKKITDTEDKLLLEGVEIKITSHDELRTLGDSVNDMTKGLVKGARDEEQAKIAYQQAAKERERAAHAQAEEAKARAETAEMNIMNLDGQAVQKAFIPLVSGGPEKATTASFKEKSLEVFGYYEGTDAVSGDYFDYKKLDERWYAFIKCDASGHGVPAALIMTIVATIFRRYFATWKYERNGVKLNLLASDINDFIESLGLHGKFAAMMICLLDTKTGDVFTCNAGDNILRYFDSAEKKMRVITLHETPAAGPLPSFMVEMKGGYKVEKFRLKSGDVLFLYTDGIEESTRFFRNADFEITPCDEPGTGADGGHGTHKRGETSEQLEPHRVQGVIEAVLNRQKYTLTRYHAAEKDEKLEFDFTRCDGTIEDTIIALTAVEKVFRMYRKPGSSGSIEKTEMNLDGKRKTAIQIVGDGIKIDRKIDAFLARYFNRYDHYCVNKVDEGETNYIYYTGVSEDVQADDLTLLAIKRM